jgi:hypothetical protein
VIVDDRLAPSRGCVWGAVFGAVVWIALGLAVIWLL